MLYCIPLRGCVSRGGLPESHDDYDNGLRSKQNHVQMYKDHKPTNTY